MLVNILRIELTLLIAYINILINIISIIIRESRLIITLLTL